MIKPVQYVSCVPVWYEWWELIVGTIPQRDSAQKNIFSQTVAFVSLISLTPEIIPDFFLVVNFGQFFNGFLSLSIY